MTENNTGQNSKILCEKNYRKIIEKFLKMKMGLNSGWFTKVGCVFAMVVVSFLLHAKLGRNDHREDAPQFSLYRAIK